MAITAGGSLNSIPSPTQNALNSNFYRFHCIRKWMGATIFTRPNGKRS